MCKEIQVKTLFEETKIFGGEIWHNLAEAQNAVQVTCRTYEIDYVIHKRVKVDGVWVVDKRKAGHLPGTRNADLIRESITIFDELVASHPSLVPHFCCRCKENRVSQEGNICLHCSRLIERLEDQGYLCPTCSTPLNPKDKVTIGEDNKVRHQYCSQPSS